jgi:hypothetical protein
MTACAAKFCNNAICLFENSRHLLSVGGHVAEEGTILPERDKQHCPGTLKFSGSERYWVILGLQIGDLDKALPT